MHSHRSDTGGSLTEYVAVILLVSAAMAAILLLALPNSVAGSIERAVCWALDLGDCDPSPEHRADEDYEPERCLQTRMTDVSGYQVEVVITVGQEFSFITETFSDGRTQVTLVDTTKLEASLGAGASLNATRAFQLGAEVSVSGGLAVPNGSTWVFDSPEEADQLMDDLRTQQNIEVAKGVSPIVGWGADLIWGPDIPDPHVTRTGLETEVGAQANAGLNIGNERRRDSGDGSGPGGGDTNGDGGVESWSVSPKLQVEGAVGVTAALSQSTDARDGSTATTYSLGGTASIGADWVVGDWKPSGGRTGTMTVTRDAEGAITGLQLTQVASDGSESTVTTTDLTVDSAEERAMVEDWLGLVADDQVLPLTWNSMAPTELGDDPSSFDRWVFENGRTSRLHYADENNVNEVSGNVKVGVSLGLGGSWGDESMDVTEAEYLGAPGGGTREYVPYRTCA